MIEQLKAQEGLTDADMDVLGDIDLDGSESTENIEHPTIDDFNSAKRILETKGTITGGTQYDEYTISLEDGKIRIDWDADTYYISDDTDSRTNKESFVGSWLSKIK